MLGPDDPILQNEAAAAAYVSAIRWPRGPYCPFCLQTEALLPEVPTGALSRYQCPFCQHTFTATTGTLLGRDGLVLTTWLRSLHILCQTRQRSLSTLLQTTLGPGDIDPQLRLVADGRTLRPSAVDRLGFRFLLPPRVSDIVLQSRHVVPADQGTNNQDARRLGVSLRSIELESDATRRIWAHDDPALIDGFHPHEDRHRWTDGHAVLPLDADEEFATAFVVRVNLANLSLRYPAF